MYWQAKCIMGAAPGLSGTGSVFGMWWFCLLMQHPEANLTTQHETQEVIHSQIEPSRFLVWTDSDIWLLVILDEVKQCLSCLLTVWHQWELGKGALGLGVCVTGSSGTGMFWKTVLPADFLHAEVLILRLQRRPLKTPTVLSAINIAVLNFWMSDEGIEADPDESMNEWWWADWKSPTERESTFLNLHFLEEPRLWHLDNWNEKKINKMHP